MAIDRTKGELSYSERYERAAKRIEQERERLGAAWCDCDFCQCYGQGAHTWADDREAI